MTGTLRGVGRAIALASGLILAGCGADGLPAGAGAGGPDPDGAVAGTGRGEPGDPGSAPIPRPVLSVGVAEAGPVQGDGSPGAEPGAEDGGAPELPFPWSTPARKGLWIWYFAYTGYDAATLADRAAADGIGYVLIKSGQDANFFTHRYDAASVREFTSRGVRVLAWAYITPADVSGSVAALARAAAIPGTSGLIVDVEAEWEGEPGAHDEAARALCQGVRAAIPGVFLGYTSFGWVANHPTMPFAAFDRDCGDAFLPQIYWNDAGFDWQTGWARARDMLARAGLRAPIWPIQSNDPSPSGDRPGTADLEAFFGAAGPRATLYEWPAAGNPALVDQLGALGWAN